MLIGCVFASGGIVLYGASTSFTAAFLARLIPGAPRGLPLQRPWRLRRSALRGRSLQHRSHVQCSSAMGSVANGVLPCCSRGRPRWPLLLPLLPQTLLVSGALQRLLCKSEFGACGAVGACECAWCSEHELRRGTWCRHFQRDRGCAEVDDWRELRRQQPGARRRGPLGAVGRRVPGGCVMCWVGCWQPEEAGSDKSVPAHLSNGRLQGSLQGACGERARAPAGECSDLPIKTRAPRRRYPRRQARARRAGPRDGGPDAGLQHGHGDWARAGRAAGGAVRRVRRPLPLLRRQRPVRRAVRPRARVSLPACAMAAARTSTGSRRRAWESVHARRRLGRGSARSVLVWRCSQAPALRLHWK